MTLQEFSDYWLQQSAEGKGIDYDGWYGDQCVDEMNQYLKDVCGISSPIQAFPGQTAYEIYQKANNSLFDKIDNNPNDPNQIPSYGDIIFWKANISGVTEDAGHVAVFLRGQAGVNKFTSLDQNYPTGSLVHEQEHTFQGVAGWLHLKTQPVALNTYGIDPTNTASAQVVYDTWHDVSQGKYISKTDYDSKVKSMQDTVDNLNQQVNDRNNDITTLNGQVKTAQGQIDSLEQQLDSATLLAKQLPQCQKELEQAVEDRKGLNEQISDLNKQIVGLSGTSYKKVSSQILFQELLKRILKKWNLHE